MKNKKRLGFFVVLVATLALILVACQPQTVEVTRVVTETVTETITVEGQPVEVTRVVTETVIETVAAESTMEEVSMDAPDPSTFLQLTIGDIDTLDPSLAYDTASASVIMNVMEPLIFYNRDDPTQYVPALSEEVPTLENGLISEDGLSYTFPIREGVTFHEGGTLEPHDVAYTFQRGLLQSDPDGPQWLLLEPILGFNNCYDITEGFDPECNLAGDIDALLATVSPEDLLAACEAVQTAVVADDDAGTVTVNLAVPWGPFLATIAQSWSHVIDMEWAVEQGSWDGSCETWQNHYAPGSENSELTPVINGTGPYMLESWTPGEGWVLVANPNYWRGDDQPVWEGGPAGQPAIETIVVNIVTEWGTRFATLQAGDAETVVVPTENRPQVDDFVGEFCDAGTGECTLSPDNPNGLLRKWGNLPNPSRTDIFMTYDIPPDSPYIGSGELDGNGIPTDFFADEHVRKAMNYCFDYDTYIQEALNGEAVRNNGPIIKGMLGYNEDGAMYEFDLEACEAELAEAWGGVLPETGFRFQIAYNTGSAERQTAGEILQASLGAINPNYQVELVGLPWPTFLAASRASQVPMAISGWLEDIHDPHNWVVPFLVGTYAFRQKLPQDVINQFNEYVQAGVATSDPAEREAIYFELQELHHAEAPQITMAQALGTRYEQRWVGDWYYNPILPGTYYYSMNMNGSSE